VKALGATPVTVAAPEVYTALERGVVDGTVFPWEAYSTPRASSSFRNSLKSGGSVVGAMVELPRQLDGLPALLGRTRERVGPVGRVSGAEALVDGQHRLNLPRCVHDQDIVPLLGGRHLDYHVELHRHYYSVPFTLVHEVVDTRVTATTVECFHKGQRVAAHVRDDTLGRHTTHRRTCPRRIDTTPSGRPPA
jgi:hypothetical protein